MPRPLERKKPLERINAMLDREALETAQRKAAQAGINPGIAGSTSAFIRWLIDKFNASNIVKIEDNDQNHAKIRGLPDFAQTFAQATADHERNVLERFKAQAIKKITKQK